MDSLIYDTREQDFAYIYFRGVCVCGDPLVHPQTESSWSNFNPIGMFSHCSKPVYLHFHSCNKLVVSLNGWSQGLNKK